MEIKSNSSTYDSSKLFGQNKGFFIHNTSQKKGIDVLCSVYHWHLGELSCNHVHLLAHSLLQQRWPSQRNCDYNPFFYYSNISRDKIAVILHTTLCHCQCVIRVIQWGMRFKSWCYDYINHRPLVNHGTITADNKDKIVALHEMLFSILDMWVL